MPPTQKYSNTDVFLTCSLLLECNPPHLQPPVITSIGFNFRHPRISKPLWSADKKKKQGKISRTEIFSLHAETCSPCTITHKLNLHRVFDVLFISATNRDRCFSFLQYMTDRPGSLQFCNY